LQFFEHAVKVLLFFLDFANVLHFVTIVLLSLILFLVTHLLLLLLVELLLLYHVCLSGAGLSRHIVGVKLVLVLNVLDLLDVDLDLTAVSFL
jgi:hypothetical protein